MIYQLFYLFFVVLLSSLDYSSSKSIKEPYFVLTKSNSDSQFAGKILSRSRRSSSEASINKFHVSSRVTSRYSRVQILSEVRNNGESAGEVSVDLRLPKKAFISNFSMIIDSVTYVGVVRAKAAAREQYEQAVARGESAGLVASKAREIQSFVVSVNIAAGNNVSFILDYEELLERSFGIYNQVIYADPGQVVEDFVIEVLISEPIGITSLKVFPPKTDESSSNNEFDNQKNLEIRRSKTQGLVRYQPSVNQQQLFSEGERAFKVTYDVVREELGGEILIKDGYFVHFFAPTNLPIIPKNVVFIIDRSGSMSGIKIRQTKQALNTVLDDLNENDRFNIITFESRIAVWQPNELVSVNQENKRRAKDFVQRIRASGGTNFYQAIIDGVNLLNFTNENRENSLERASMLIILTDGQPTAGITNRGQIERGVTEAIDGRFSLFCLGFGSNLDHDFLKRLAHENRGIARRIYADSDAELQLKGFYKEVASPLLLHGIIKYRGRRTEKVTTNRFDNYFDGSEILVVGRFDLLENSVNTAETLEGVVEARSVQENVTLVAVSKEMEESFIDDDFDMEKIWAYLTIKDLIKNKTYLTANNEPINEIDSKILQLSIRYNFVTPLTSMVVTKPNKSEVVEAAEPRRRPTTVDIPQAYSSYAPRRIASRNWPSYNSVASRNLYSGRSFFQPQRLGGFAPNRQYFQSLYSGAFYIGPTWTRTTTTTTPTTTTTTTTPTTTTTTTPTTTATTTPEPTTPYINPNPENPLILLSDSCGSIIELDSFANITSPDYPGLYPKNSQCVWQVTLPNDNGGGANKRIRVTFPSLDIEGGSCERDRVIIYSDFDPETMESEQVVRRCGYEIDNSHIEARHNVVIVFQSDQIVSGRGFLANLELVTL